MGHHASERVEYARDVTPTTFGVLSPMEPSADPMLDTIVRWKGALERFYAAFGEDADSFDDTAANELAEATWRPILADIVAHTPRTASYQGALAAIELILSEIGYSLVEPWHRSFLGSALDYLKQSDVELKHLGGELEDAIAAEKAIEAAYNAGQYEDEDVALDATYASTHAIIDQIVAIPASTIEGLRIKARAIQWCYHDDPVDLVVDQNTTDLRIANSLIADLLAVPPAVGALPVAPDPMLTLIERWIDGNRRYGETPSDLLNDIEDEQKAAEATYGPPLRELRDETPETTTRAGAAAAIESVLDDNLVMDWGIPVLKSVLAYLRQAPGSKIVEAEVGSC